MQLTRQGRATLALVAGLALFAVVLRSWVVLAGTALLGAWVVARGVLFVAALSRLDETLTLRQELPTTARPDEPLPVTLTGRLSRPAPVDVEIAARLPVVADGPADEHRTVRLAPGMREATTTFEIRIPVAGTVTVDRPEVRATDGRLFAETFSRGDPRRVAVQPRVPNEMHVGRGGQEIAVGYGEHDAQRPRGGGIEPESVREYTPSDSVRRIDWKATARLQTPQVREFIAETDRESVLLVDHRAATDVGRPGETAYEYLREVALAFLDRADRVDDPLGCVTIGDEGLTGNYPIAATESSYGRIRRHLSTLAPTTSDADGTTHPGSARTRSPSEARDAAVTLDGDDAFSRTLAPYFEAGDRYVARIDGDPLFAAARRATRTARHTVFFTTDADRSAIRESVKLARRGGRLVTVFLAPRALYEAGGLSDLETAYDAYRDFEEFRRSLSGLDRVDAYEVAPGARLAAVLDSRQSRRGVPA